jgi:diguanylate cyclase (GGDEF)-like protein/PAS domain S-box-containing protein
MQKPQLRDDEAGSLAALRALDVLDSTPEAEFDALVRAASLTCGTPIALFSLIDSDRQWFKANVGLAGVSETARDDAFCAHAVLGDALLEVTDATLDRRFADNPLVTGEPGIRFYAGAPVRLSGGHRIGTLCIIDRQPRQLSDTQRETLQCLALAAASLLEGRRAARALAAEHQRLANIIDGTDVGTWEWNVRTGELRVNQRFAQIAGHTLTEPAPTTIAHWTALIHPDDLQRAQAQLQQHFEQHTERYSCELRLRHRDGHWVWVMDRGRVMTRTADGQPEWMFGSRRDISDRKWQDVALRKSEEFLDRTGRLAGVGGWELDVASGEVTWSDETRRIHGVAADYQPMLATAISFYAPEARPVIQAAVEHAMAAGEGWDLELPLVRADGRPIWARAVGAVESVDGKPVRLVGAFQDITDRQQLQRSLMAASDEVADLYDHAPCGYFSVDGDGRFLKINALGLSWLGCAREDLIGRLGPADFFSDEGRALFERSFPGFKTDGRIDAQEFDLISRDGTLRRVSMSATAVHDSDGQFVMSRSVLHDVTEMHRIRAELKQMNRQQAAMLDNELVGIFTARQRIVCWKNKALNRLLGYQGDELLGQPTRLMYAADSDHAELGAVAYPLLAAGQHYRAQLQMRRKNGDLVWVDLSGVMLSAEDNESLWMMVDISQIKQYQAQVEHIAFHDPLTGLPNRLLLADRLNQALKVAQRLNSMLAVGYLDLDGFKQVNDQHGHAAGDVLLKDMAQRLQLGVRGSDTVARVGGDEFVVVLTPVENADDALRILQRLQAALLAPCALDARSTACVAGSIGVALYPAHGRDANVLVAMADQAMFEAKRAGRGQLRVYGS